MKLASALVLLFLACIIGAAQECPPPMVCISQSAANQAAQNVRELEATKEKVKVLEDALRAKDESIRELEKTNAQNVSDLKEALKRTELQLAQTNGQLIARESEIVNQRAIITALLPMIKKKRNAFITIF